MAPLGLQRLFILIPYLGVLCLCVGIFFSHGTADLPRANDSKSIGKLRRGWWLKNHTSTIDERMWEAEVLYSYKGNGSCITVK